MITSKVSVGLEYTTTSLAKNIGKGLASTPSLSKIKALFKHLQNLSWELYTPMLQPSFKLAPLSSLEQTFVHLKPYFSANLNGSSDCLNTLKDIPLQWVVSQGLTHQSEGLYPVNWHNNAAGISGLGIGITKEEAILDGLYDILGRHNLNQILHNPTQKTQAVSLETLTNTSNNQSLHYVLEQNIILYCFDISSTDYPLPTFLILGESTSHSPLLHYIHGLGCHLNPAHAMDSALQSFIHGLLELKSHETFIPESEQKQYAYSKQVILKSLKKTSNQNLPLILSEIPNLEKETFDVDIQQILSFANKAAHKIFIINKSHTGLQVPVYRVFIPKVESFFEFGYEKQTRKILIAYALKQAGLEAKCTEWLKQHFRDILRDNKYSLFSYLSIFKLNKEISPMREYFENPKFEIEGFINFFLEHATYDNFPSPNMVQADYHQISEMTSAVIKQFSKQ